MRRIGGGGLGGPSSSSFFLKPVWFKRSRERGFAWPLLGASWSRLGAFLGPSEGHGKGPDKHPRLAIPTSLPLRFSDNAARVLGLL